MKTLVIVESPAKAKTITKFLGRGYTVESSFGHIRDLPKSKIGIDIEGGTFLPSYIIPKEKTAQVKKLKDLAKKSDRIIFATDEDREGEAISWHLAQVFDIPTKQAERIVFHEITKTALESALAAPRGIDDVGDVRRMADGLVEVLHVDRSSRARVVERHDHAIARPLGQPRAGLEVVDALLEVPCGASLSGGAALDLVEPRAEFGQLRLERVLLGLQGIGGVGEGGVVPHRELAPLGLGPPLRRHQEAKEHRRHHEDERMRDPPGRGSCERRHEASVTYSTRSPPNGGAFS